MSTEYQELIALHAAVREAHDAYETAKNRSERLRKELDLAVSEVNALRNKVGEAANALVNSATAVAEDLPLDDE